jgi:hypothetical protein
MEKIKYNREHPPAKEVMEELDKHESDLMPDVDEDPEEKEEDVDVTGIELYQASVAIREVARAEKQPLPELEEHPDGHKKPEVLDRLNNEPMRMQTKKRVSRIHEMFTAVDSLGEYKSTPVIPRPPSASNIRVLTVPVPPSQIEVVLCMGTLPDTPVKILEHTNMEGMRQIASTVFGGRCRVSTDQFPLRNGSRITAIPSFLPPTAKPGSVPVVVPYLIHKDQRRAVEIMPDTPMDMLEQIAAAHMDSQRK